MTTLIFTDKKINLRAIACLSAATLLTACGGGGGGGSSQGSGSIAADPAYSSAVDTSVAASGSTTSTTASDSIASSAAASVLVSSGSSGNEVSSNASTATSSGTSAARPEPAPAASAVGAAGPFGQNASAFTLTFADEFNSGSLNTSVWNESVWYESGNATKNYTVENGALKIWPQRDASGKFFNRTIDTDGHYYQTYGYFEVEAKLPVGKGTWPAFWLFNHIGTRRPEIDVMEAYAGGAAPWGTTGSDGARHPTMYAATIWKDASVQAGMQKVPTPDLSAGFHKYALKWEPNKQTFYFDGREVYSINVTMSDRMYLMLDLWFGSASGTPDNSTPQGKANSYEVNYIRAWKFN